MTADSDSDSVFAIDIGGTNLRSGLVNCAGEVSHFAMVSSTGILEVEDPSKALGDYIESRLGLITDRPPIGALSIGFPATIDRTRTKVLSTSNIAAMQHLEIVQYLESTTGIPTVIDRDVNMVMRHDLVDLQLQDGGVVAGLYVGTGLGNSIAVNGQICFGAHGVAGELGHLPVRGLTTVCGCGNTGCIETIASGKYLVELASELGEGVSVENVFRDWSDHPKVQEFVRNIAFAAASEINIIDPDVMVLGGGVIQSEWFPMEALIEAIRAHTRKPLPSSAVSFVASRGGQLAGVVGAALFGFESIDAGEPAEPRLMKLESL